MPNRLIDESKQAQTPQPQMQQTPRSLPGSSPDGQGNGGDKTPPLPFQPAEPVEPVEPVESVESVEPVEPAKKPDPIAEPEILELKNIKKTHDKLEANFKNQEIELLETKEKLHQANLLLNASLAQNLEQLPEQQKKAITDFSSEPLEQLKQYNFLVNSGFIKAGKTPTPNAVDTQMVSNLEAGTRNPPRNVKGVVSAVTEAAKKL